jgi:hypothetical protein
MVFDYFNDINDKNLNTKLPEWCVNQINDDLQIFNKNDVSHKKLCKIMKNSQGKPDLLLVRFKIIDGKLFFYKGNTSALLRHNSSYRIADKYKYICSILYKITRFVNDVDFIISLQDCCNNNEIQPIFTFSKDVANNIEKYNILVPDWLTLRGTHKDSWNNLKKRLDYYKSQFHCKNNKIVWRGSASNFVREKFIKISQKNKSIIDCNKNFLKQEEHLQYKYQIVFDGFRCTWPGYLWRLYSGCLTIKHESTQIQWFYGALTPYIHYVPLKKDFDEEDLIKLYKWVNENEEKCKLIADNAEKFIINNVSVEDMLSYYITVLNKYAEIQHCSKNLKGFSDNVLYFNTSLWYYFYTHLSEFWVSYKTFKFYILIVIIGFVILLSY